jgi:hypothetical protein
MCNPKRAVRILVSQRPFGYHNTSLSLSQPIAPALQPQPSGLDERRHNDEVKCAEWHRCSCDVPHVPDALQAWWRSPRRERHSILHPSFIRRLNKWARGKHLRHCSGPAWTCFTAPLSSYKIFVFAPIPLSYFLFITPHKHILTLNRQYQKTIQLFQEHHLNSKMETIK